MLNKDKSELRNLSVAELQQGIQELKQQLLALKLDVATSHVKDYSLFKKLRRNIAQLSTFVRQKELSF
ncbi:MAG: 50S ribosomal protein L29 [Candidatus Babeliales bacterium]